MTITISLLIVLCFCWHRTGISATLEKMRYILLIFLCASCTQTASTPSYMASLFQTSRKPLVAILPMEDFTENHHASKTVKALTHSVINRLDQKNHFSIVSSKASGKQFLVTTQLVQHDETLLDSSELAISVHLKIVDLRTDKPQVVFQEVINHHTLLETPLSSEDNLNWQDPAFRVSPIGLAHAKLSREVAARIEDYIKLAVKG